MRFATIMTTWTKHAVLKVKGLCDQVEWTSRRRKEKKHYAVRRFYKEQLEV